MHYFAGDADSRRALHRARLPDLDRQARSRTRTPRRRARSPADRRCESLVIETDSPYGRPSAPRQAQRARVRRRGRAHVAELRGELGRDRGSMPPPPTRCVSSLAIESHGSRREARVKTQALYGPVQEDLRLVEETLDAQARRDFPARRDARHGALGGGGKRLRPAIALLAGTLRRLQPRPARAARGVDRAAAHGHARPRRRHRQRHHRRGRATANSAFHNSTTVMLGDYMFAHAANQIVRTDNIRVVRLFADTLMIMAKGELRQDIDAYDSRRTIGLPRPHRRQDGVALRDRLRGRRDRRGLPR